MGLIGNIILGTLAIVVTSVLARLVGDDIKAWLPKITNRLTESAVNKLPPSERERFAEEWRSHINDTPGDIGKLLVAASFQRASRVILKEIQSAKSVRGVTELPAEVVTNTVLIPPSALIHIHPELPHVSIAFSGAGSKAAAGNLGQEVPFAFSGAGSKASAGDFAR